MSNNPMRQYVRSSRRLVARVEIQANFSAAGTDIAAISEFATRFLGIPDALVMLVASPSLVPIYAQSMSKKNTRGGARSSCRVHPRRNHWLLSNAAIVVSRSSSDFMTSAKYAQQKVQFRYQLYMELIASESSALLVLSMQHVSTHTH